MSALRKGSILILLLSRFRKLLYRHPYLLLLIPLIFIVHPLSVPGISLAGDFPYLDTSYYASNRLWTWLERGSIDGFEFLSRLPIIGSWHLLSFIGINSELATKSMVVLGFLLSSFSFYVSFLLFFKDKFTHSDIALKLSALMGSYFYAYNEWSFNRIHHWYLWIGYSILPLFFISIYYSFKHPKEWKYIISSILVWSLASTTPHMTLFYGIILGVTFLGFIFNNLKSKKNGVIRLVFIFVVIIACYMLVNMYWVYPYILALKMQVIAPNYELTQEILEVLSREGNFVNTLSILGYWLSSDVITPDNSYYFIWVYASIVIPIAAFSSLLLRKSIKYALIFSGISLIATLLAMGTRSPIDYYKLILTNPMLTSFAWLLRDADKWSSLIVFAYSFLIGMVSYKFFSVTKEKNYNRRKLMISCSFVFLLLGAILVVSYPFYTARMDPLKPVILPAEFDKLNVYLSTIDEDKVYFIPYPLYETQWQKSGRVGTIYQSHSIKASIESTEYNFHARNYYNYLANSIQENNTKRIGNLISPLGTSYLIFHNDTWSKTQNSYDKYSINLLNKLYLMEDLKNVENVGFYKIFKTSNNKDGNAVEQINIPTQNIGVLSGLDTFASLSTIPSFNTLRSSLFFLDESNTETAANFIRGLDELILSGSSSADDLVFSFIDDKYLIAPLDATYRNEPSEVWSRSRATDPIHAEYHPPLENLGITNWDFDYGKGLVMTKAMGTNLSVPVETLDQINNSKNQDNEHYLFVRYLKNQKGGQIKIHLDNKLIQTIDTLDRNVNKFVWQKVDLVNLTKGNHTLKLENVVGFNAVNLFALISHEEMDRLRTVVNGILEEDNRIIYLLEAESNFYYVKGIETDTLLLFGNNSGATGVKSNDNNHTGKDLRTIEGQFKVPENSDLVALRFFTEGNTNMDDSFSINALEISPLHKKYSVFSSDFERKVESIPLGSLRKLDWINYDKDLQTTSIDTNNPLYGNYSLKVSTKQGNKVGWNILSTDFIPLKQGSYYDTAMDVSATDVKQLHSRILYYDFNGKEMTGATDYIVDGTDGTFRDTFTFSIVPPKEARYLKIQVLTLSSNAKTSSYLLDNVKIDEFTFPTRFEKKSSFDQGPNVSDSSRTDYLDINVERNASNSIIQTKPFPVHQNLTYNYTITTETKNIQSYYAQASFKDSGDVSQNNSKYGYNASNGNVLSLSNGSEIQSQLEIIKPGNYSIALRAMTCDTCTFLNLSIQNTDDLAENKYDNNIQSNFISLKDKSSGLKWLNSNSTYHLNKGTYALKIYSDSHADLDSVIIYQNNNNITSEVTETGNQTLGNLFNINSPAAKLTEFKKINPTKYVINIENATRPYIISLAEAYDPLWIAHDIGSGENNNFKTNSFQLYGVVNGFFINKTGSHSLVLEYQPQKWFTDGGTVSIFVITAIFLGLLFFRKRRTTITLCSAINRGLKKYLRK